MNQKLKVIVTAIISFVMVTLGTLSFAATTFSDIEGHWAKTVVEEMAVKGVLNGFEDGTFRPDESVTREQFAKILVETLKIAGNTTNIKFVDIEEDRWSKDYIYRASRYLTGYENNGKYFFRPTEASVREDVAVAVVQAEGLQTEKPDYTLLNQLSDSGEISEGIKKYVAIAVKNEIMRGKDGYFDPQGNLTRAEVSQLMYNVFQKIAIGELESFSIGDVNGDGKITEEDAVLLYNYTVFPEDYASEIPYAIRRNADKYLDLDQDGNVDVIDAMVLKAYVNKDIKDYFKILEPEFPEWLNEYIDTKELLSQQYISMTCGTIYSDLFESDFFFSSLDHSVAVALIVWHFTRDKKQTLSGLFHDIATPAFKHCVDFLNGDYMTQESTEDLTTEIIKNSNEIMKLLKRDNIEISELDDYRKELNCASEGSEANGK